MQKLIPRVLYLIGVFLFADVVPDCVNLSLYRIYLLLGFLPRLNLNDLLTQNL